MAGGGSFGRRWLEEVVWKMLAGGGSLGRCWLEEVVWKTLAGGGSLRRSWLEEAWEVSSLDNMLWNLLLWKLNTNVHVPIV